MPLLNGKVVRELADLFKTSLNDASGLVLPSIRHLSGGFFVVATLKEETREFLKEIQEGH